MRVTFLLPPGIKGLRKKAIQRKPLLSHILRNALDRKLFIVVDICLFRKLVSEIPEHFPDS